MFITSLVQRHPIRRIVLKPRAFIFLYKKLLKREIKVLSYNKQTKHDKCVLTSNLFFFKYFNCQIRSTWLLYQNCSENHVMYVPFVFTDDQSVTFLEVRFLFCYVYNFNIYDYYKKETKNTYKKNLESINKRLINNEPLDKHISKLYAAWIINFFALDICWKLGDKSGS